MIRASNTPMLAVMCAAMALAGCVTPPKPLTAPNAETLARVQQLEWHPCNYVTASALDAYGFPANRISSLSYSRQTTGGEVVATQSFTAWIVIAGESQHVIVNHRDRKSVV